MNATQTTTKQGETFTVRQGPQASGNIAPLWHYYAAGALIAAGAVAVRMARFIRMQPDSATLAPKQSLFGLCDYTETHKGAAYIMRLHYVSIPREDDGSLPERTIDGARAFLMQGNKGLAVIHVDDPHTDDEAKAKAQAKAVLQLCVAIGAPGKASYMAALDAMGLDQALTIDQQQRADEERTLASALAQVDADADFDGSALVIDPDFGVISVSEAAALAALDQQAEEERQQRAAEACADKPKPLRRKRNKGNK